MPRRNRNASRRIRVEHEHPLDPGLIDLNQQRARRRGKRGRRVNQQGRRAA